MQWAWWFLERAGYFHDQSIKGVYSSLYPQIYQLQNNLNDRNAQISSLTAEVSDLQSQVSSLKSQLSADNQQITQLQSTIDKMQAQLNKMEAPNMDGVFTFIGGGCFFGCSATLRGAWVNYGTQNARSVVVTLTWSKAGSFVQSNTINVGVVAGQSIALYPDTGYTLTSQVDHVDWTFAFTS